ncbi:MAG TPA: C-GCAxxG-C-C family protein [Anaerolineales bacterium]|nr:C-GCAxxG-C-C family protein [Anaerolineales bacterium]
MLLAVAEHQHIQSEVIPRIASGFCGGLAHTGGMCGAVSGGIMAISLSLGRDIPDRRNDQCYKTVQEFMKRFADRFGEVNCQKLTGVLVGTLEGKAIFNEKGQIKLCTEYVGEAVRFVLELVETN